MKKYILSFIVICTIVVLNSCKKSDDNLTPSGLVESYSLPQGNSAYDQTIVNYYQSYGSYMLYKFTDRDVYWTPTVWTKPTGPTATGYWTPGIEVTPSLAAYIPAQLDLIKKKWFSYYTDKFLKKFLPVKIILCSKADSVVMGYVFTPTFAYSKSVKKVAAYYNYDNIVVNYGDATVTTMTRKDSIGFAAKANLTFIQSIIARGLTTPTSEFINSADYITVMTTYAQAYGKGILAPYFSATVQADWNAYILAMVNYSEVNLNTATAITDSTPVGMLNATKDTNGQVRKRYNLVRNYFISEYQVDLQKIGNASKGL